MVSDQDKETGRSELSVKGLLVKEGVKIAENQNVADLSARGYGVKEEDGEFTLMFSEALYLLDRGLLDVEDKKKRKVGFRMLLESFEAIDENAWVKYLVYRDLRSRGYAIREGFGEGADFRVYERGEYGKETAKYLVLNVQEGKPIAVEDLTRIMLQSQSLKKELVLAVMNRRGEIVYYTVGQLTLK